MDPVTRAVLTSWEWRTTIIITLASAGVFYSVGWGRLRRRQRRESRLANRWRLISYWSGLLVIALALMSPIDVLSSQLFFMHMIQHLLLVMIAPPLLMLANPLPFVLWGLPAGARRIVGNWLSQILNHRSPSRHWLRTLSGPGLVWFLLVCTLIGWHDPNAYNAALRYPLVHDLEHLTFFLPAVLYWWLATGAGPRLHKQLSLPARTAFVMAAIPPNMLIGMAIAFSSEPIYTYYLTVPRLWQIEVMLDQALAGVIMWVPGSMMYIVAALILIGRWFSLEEAKPPLPVTLWSTEESMIAPGFEKEGKQR